MPVIFLSHGAPPVFDDPKWVAELFDWANNLPKPTGIVVLSAHWEAAPARLSNPSAATPLVYDFGGFHPHYFTMTYPAPDASWLAAAVTGLFARRGRPSPVLDSRGLDHGAWVPLKVMYPDADIPVVQLSLPSQDPHLLMTLGADLAELRQQGVLIIGSGFMTHGLPYLSAQAMMFNEIPGWSADFDTWAEEILARADVNALLDYFKAPGMPYAHPTVEHFTPLFVAMGAASNPEKPGQTVIDGFQMGLAKRSVQWS